MTRCCQFIFMKWNGNKGWLKVSEDTSHASFKFSWIKYSEQWLPSKDPSDWDGLQQRLMTWQPRNAAFCLRNTRYVAVFSSVFILRFTEPFSFCENLACDLLGPSSVAKSYSIFKVQGSFYSSHTQLYARGQCGAGGTDQGGSRLTKTPANRQGRARGTN